MSKNIPGSSEFQKGVTEKCGGKCLTVGVRTDKFFKGEVTQRCSIRYLNNHGGGDTRCLAIGSEEEIGNRARKLIVTPTCPWTGNHSESEIERYNEYLRLEFDPDSFEIVYPDETVKK